MKPANYWIEHLGLEPHPEGGFFKETYRSDDMIDARGLPERFQGERAASTGIYFLLRSQDISHLHKIDADEMWHFYAGSPLTVHMINMAGDYTAYHIGPNPEKNETFQAVVPAGVWFGATVDPLNSYALVGCTVAPGFEFTTFELAKKQDMKRKFPDNISLIDRLCLD